MPYRQIRKATVLIKDEKLQCACLQCACVYSVRVSTVCVSIVCMCLQCACVYSVHVSTVCLCVQCACVYSVRASTVCVCLQCACVYSVRVSTVRVYSVLVSGCMCFGHLFHKLTPAQSNIHPAQNHTVMRGTNRHDSTSFAGLSSTSHIPVCPT